MTDFDVEKILASISDAMDTMSKSTEVIGEPIEAAGKVIIPAVVVRMGFGAGGGSGVASHRDDEATDETGGGGGGGGGMLISPVFLVVDDEGERFLTVPGASDSLRAVIDGIRDAFEGWRSTGTADSGE